MAATIFSNASFAKPGMKVEVTQRIPRHVLRDTFEASDKLLSQAENGIPRGVLGRVEATRAGYVVVELSYNPKEYTVEKLRARDSYFEKYFAERL